ncbi:MAG: hypothetical protein OEX07_08205 [Gammaproteobacteria bacterium]|nr:hypothetical protein [Gammaproteobacteria bacterium]
MEESEFKSIYKDINRTPCVYQKAILSARCECPHGHKLNIAEREAVACDFIEAREQCQILFDSFIQKARFALRKLDESPLTHAETIKIQVGGITGLQDILKDKSSVPKVGNLTMKAFLEYPDLDNLPIDIIVRSIVHCKVRNRSR